MGNILVGTVLVIMVVVLVRGLINDHKKGGCAGCSGCGGSCAGCGMHQHSATEEHRE